MTFGEKLRNFLAAAKASAPAGSWTAERWVQCVDEFADVERPVGKNGKAKAPKKKVSDMADEEWLQHLEKQEALAGVDIRRELGKAQFWAGENGRQCTRKFFVNWLGKAPRTLTTNGHGQSSRQQVVGNIDVEPPNWYPVAVKLFKEFAADTFKKEGWKRVDPYYRKAIVKEML